MVRLTFLTTALLISAPASSAFSISRSTQLSSSTTTNRGDVFSLGAKKKSRSNAGQGFSKAPKPEVPTLQPDDSTSATDLSEPNASQTLSGLTSVEGASSFATPEIEVDPNLPTEERTKAILKQKFGLRTFEEQQGDIKAAAKMAENSKRMSKIKQMKDEEFDIFMVIPPPLLRFIDIFLKGGLTVSTILFVLAGFGITAEAWSVATSKPLPENIDNFIVNTIEPNFTPGLLVLLGFSISLGIFATAQLGSGSSSYQENP
jgi:hypothetical protein